MRPPIDAAVSTAAAKAGGHAVAYHQWDGDGADDRRVGGAGAGDHADRARSEHRRLRHHLARATGDDPHHADHGALRVESVGDAGDQQEGGDQGQRKLAVDAVDAGRELDRRRRHHAVPRRPGMPEEIDRAEIPPKRVEDENDVGPEQHRMCQPRQLHHQQEHQQADEEVLRGVGSLPPDRDLFELAVEMDESVDADADIDRNDDVVGGARQEFVEIAVLVHEQDLQDQRDRHHIRDELLRAAGAGPEIPDQPSCLDHCEDEDDVSQRHQSHQILGFVARHFRLPRPVARRGGTGA